MGMKLLLDAADGNVKEALLFEQYIELKAEVEELRKEISEMTTAVQEEETKKKKIKTFGG